MFLIQSKNKLSLFQVFSVALVFGAMLSACSEDSAIGPGRILTRSSVNNFDTTSNGDSTPSPTPAPINSSTWTAASCANYLASAQSSLVGSYCELLGTAPTYSSNTSCNVNVQMIRPRPFSTADAGKAFELPNYLKFKNLTNYFGIYLTTTDSSQSSAPTFASATFRNMVFENTSVNGCGIRDFAGIKVTADVSPTTAAADVFFDSVSFSGGTATPILIKESHYKTVSFKNVSVTGMNENIRIESSHLAGGIQHLIIENSPGLNITVLGRADGISKVSIINSAGAKVNSYSGGPLVCPAASSYICSGNGVWTYP